MSRSPPSLTYAKKFLVSRAGTDLLPWSEQARARGHLAVPTAPSRELLERARSHAAMQPEERWDGTGQRMNGCGWALEIPARLIEEWLIR